MNQAPRAVRLLVLLSTLGMLLATVLPSDARLAVPSLAAVGVHELGHLLALSLLGEPPPAFGLRRGGLCLTARRTLSYRAEALLALGGPLANLLFAVLLLFLARIGGGGSEYLGLCAALQLSAGLWNLLPIGTLDGGRILGALLCRLPPSVGDTVTRTVNDLTLLFGLAVSLGILYFSGAGFYTSLALLLLLISEA